MIELRLEIEDLADTRFAVSPLLEAAMSLRMWHFPGYYVLQLPWLRQARADLEGVDIGLLLDLVGHRQRTVPDFLLPRPDDPVTDFATELATAAQTPPDTVASDIVAAHGGAALPSRLRQRLGDPAALRDEIIDLLAGYWEKCLARHWPRMRGVLEADMLFRAQQMARGGFRLLFSDLHPMMTWSEGRLRVEQPVPHADARIPVTGRGLCLVPALFVNTPCPPMSRDGLPMVIYPARGLATVWESAPPPPPGALEALLGRPRAVLLSLLDRPASTTELARRLAVTPGAISQHLGVLRNAGLVSRAPAGRVVLYTRSDLGERLHQSVDTM